jgi:ribosome maturation factor RimP
MKFTDKEIKIFNLLEPTIELMGFELVLVNITNHAPKMVKIIIDSKNSIKLTIGDCKKVSRIIGPMFDIEDIFPDKYILEVSSAGIERPLVKIADYAKFIGRYVLIKLHQSLDGKKIHQGLLMPIEDDNIVLQVQEDKVQNLKKICFDNIKAANLVLTDEMFKAILKN